MKKRIVSIIFENSQNAVPTKAELIFDQSVATFDSDGGSAVASQTVDTYDKITEPSSNPTRVGFVFAGWYLGEELYDFNNPLESDITLVAHWTELFTVTFDSDGGSAVESQTVEDGDLATEPSADPTKVGFVFAGWYLGENLFVFTTPITANTTLVAHWTQE